MCLLGRRLAMSSLLEEVAFGTGEATAFRASKLQLREEPIGTPGDGALWPSVGYLGSQNLGFLGGTQNWLLAWGGGVGVHPHACPSLRAPDSRVLSIISSALQSSRRLGGADGGPGGMRRSPQDHLNMTAVERTLSLLVSTALPFPSPDCLLAQVSLPLRSCLSPFPGGTEPPSLCLQPSHGRGSTCL